MSFRDIWWGRALLLLKFRWTLGKCIVRGTVMTFCPPQRKVLGCLLR